MFLRRRRLIKIRLTINVYKVTKVKEGEQELACQPHRRQQHFRDGADLCRERTRKLMKVKSQMNL